MIAIDSKMSLLVERRKEIVHIITEARERLALCVRAERFARVIKSISEIKDSTTSLYHANTYILPWRHSLPRKYFANTLVTIPEGFPSNWTRAKSAEFISSLDDALERDIEALETAAAVAQMD